MVAELAGHQFQSVAAAAAAIGDMSAVSYGTWVRDRDDCSEHDVFECS